MTDHITSLTPAAMREIIGKLDEGLALFEQQKGRLSASESKVQQMMVDVRNQLSDQLARHPDFEK